MAEPQTPMDFAHLYDIHAEYEARRQIGSFEQERTDLEVRAFKLPLLLDLVRDQALARSVLEIGCATGELLAAFPVAEGGERVGVDISPANVVAAKQRFPGVEFLAGDFRNLLADRHFGYAVMSDVIEHVPDDEAFLRAAAALADQVLVNLPLEDNWLNRRRVYGPQDSSGHLRKYSRAQGLDLFERAGLEVIGYREVWVHEHHLERARRRLHAGHFGHAYTGTWPVRQAKRLVFALSRVIRPLGRWLFASNLFVLARPRV